MSINRIAKSHIAGCCGLASLLQLLATSDAHSDTLRTCLCSIDTMSNKIIYAGLCFAQFCTFAAYVVVTAGAGVVGVELKRFHLSDVNPVPAMP